MQIKIDRDSRQTVYMQIVEQVSAAVEGGQLAPDARLPTVRELADSLDIARGTVKHAYDELEKRGVIRMIQGRGTFVHGRRERPLGKKERAMQAIGALFEELGSLGFELKLMVFLKQALGGFIGYGGFPQFFIGGIFFALGNILGQFPGFIINHAYASFIFL